MKHHLYYLSWFLFANTAFSQQVTFTQHTDRINPVTGFAAYADCVVDMNGDFLDDVVRIGGKGLFIDYQEKGGTFTQRQFNFPVQSRPSWSICAGDLDNNRFNDLLLADSETVSFLKANDSGTEYEEILMPVLVQSQRSTMADINNDGWLDAFVCHESGQNIPFRNTGAGNMIPDINLIPTADRPGNYSAIWTDYDNDIDIDLYISKCLGGALPGDINRTNLLYRNNNDGTFTEIAGMANVDDNAQSWSTSFEDFDNDGDFDAFVVNHDMANRLYRNNGDGTFTDVISASGIDPFDLGAFENSSGDFNNDGFMDIFSELNLRLYLGHGDLTFTGQDAPVTPGGIGDLNDDGFLDVFHDNKLWINNGNENHWVKINTIGLESNHNGIGARIEIYGAWGRQIREVRSGQSFSPMSSLTTHFGIGQATQIDSMIIRWPSKIISKIIDPAIDTTHFIPEGSCIGLPIKLDVTGIISLCPSETVSLSAPDGYIKYFWSDGDTTQHKVLTNEGMYYVIVTDSTGCISISDLVEVERIQDTVPVISSDSSIRFCEGDTITLTSTPGQNYRWSTGEILNQSIRVYESGIYTVAVDAKCFDGQITSPPVNIVTLPADVPVVSNIFAFPGDSLLLIAEGENIHWYDQPVGGNLLGIGDTLQTSILNSNTTYYLEAHHQYGSQMQSGGKPDTSGDGGLPLQAGSMLFEAWEPFILDSVTVYVPAGGPQGVRFVQLLTNDTVQAFKSFNVQTGANVLHLDFYVPVGKHVLTSPQGNLFRNTGNLNYPYPIGDAGEITGSSNGENYYYYFYDWKITKPGLECISERVPLHVIVSETTDPGGNEEFKLYPNPSDGTVYLEWKDIPASFKVYITDALGNNILKQKISGQLVNTFDISGLPSGIYYMQVIREEMFVAKNFILLKI